MLKAAERRQAAERRRGGAPECRHSCDEVLTASFHSAGHGESDTGSRSSDCQRCVLNSISNRTLSRELGTSGDRFISQRQYKRKIRRESGREGGYSTLDLRTERKLSNGRNGGGERASTSTRLVSKTTYKLKRYDGSDLDSAGEEKSEKSSMELMEVPLSPTHYEQPPTPDHDPPSAWEAESAIHAVLSFLRNEHQPRHRTTATATEPWMLLPLDPTTWPPTDVPTTEKTTCTSTGPPPPLSKGRALPDIPKDEGDVAAPKTNGHGPAPSNGHTLVATPDSEDESAVVLRPKTLGGDAIYQELDYQSIGGEESSVEESSEPNRGSRGSEAGQSLAMLSPFDEQEEWSKISQIINSFGADIGKQTEAARERKVDGKEQCNTPHNSPVYEYPTLKRREKLASSVQEWLRYISMEKYLNNFESSGYDDLSFMGGGMMSKEDLVEIGIDDQKDCSVLIDSLRLRNHKFIFNESGEPERKELAATGLEVWLQSIGLSQYVSNFR